MVHGGLTAAIFDEAFGGLLFSLKKARAVQFWGPAYTVQLEVSYKSKISAGAKILCTTEVESVEGRKLWMKATMSGVPRAQRCHHFVPVCMLVVRPTHRLSLTHSPRIVPSPFCRWP